ncbi:MAG: ATP-binding protein [Polyangiaceae bacterium]
MVPSSGPGSGNPNSSGERFSDPGSEFEAARTVLAADTTPPEDPADRGLVMLRWVAVVGMAITIVAADRLVSGLPIPTLMAILLGIGASNLLWLALISRVKGSTRSGLPAWSDARPGRGDEPDRAPQPRRYVEAQLAVDVVCLATMLWFAGGLSNPFAVFLAFQIALAGLLCTPRATFGIAALTIVVTVGLATADPLPPLTPFVVKLGTALGLTSLSVLLGLFVALYARRLSRLRNEIARNEKLAVLGRLVGGMSHELNTPLATILLLSRDLERFGGEMPSEEVHQLVSTIAREAERANEIIGLVRGRIRPDQAPEPVELCSFVEEHARAELSRLGFEGEQRFVCEPPIVFPVLRAALVQVLANLLRNACEASILGRKKRITISVVSRDGRAEIWIEDRGAGFSPEVLARLGEPFQTTKEDRGGMGLGLYVSALLSKQMGARLMVQPLKQGARVVLSLTADLRPSSDESR